MTKMATSKMISLTIDGQPVSVPEGTLIVDAAKRIGIDIPVFCYHPKMEPVGMCRMCLVEVGRPLIDRATGKPLINADGVVQIQMAPKLETACTTPVTEGMVVIGMNEKVETARKDVIEFILTSHPLDCPVCDKGGECPLQNLTMHHGPGQSRFLFDEKMRLEKHVPLGELIYLDRERCIQCGRCVRFQDEIAGDPVIGFHNRGRSLEIITNSDPGFDSYFSGNTSDICPVGALTTADFRFGARPWELKPVASVCAQCPVGCNVTFNVRREARSNGEIVIKRVMPRQHESVNEIWICDKGRFTGYHFAESPARLTQPLVRKAGALQPATWDEALEAAAAGLKATGKQVLALGSGRLANEDLFNLREFAQGLGGIARQHTFMGGGEQVLQFGMGAESNLGDLGKGDAILVVASDLEEEAPIWWLRVKQAAQRGATLIVANPRPTKTDKYASHVLRYTYGSEAALVLGMIQTLGSQKTRLPDWLAHYKASAEVQAAAKAFGAAANAVVLFGQEGASLESTSALAGVCANLLFITDHAGKPNNGLIGVWAQANSQGAWELGLPPVTRADLSGAKALLIAAADPAGDQPELLETLHAADFVVVQELFLTETAKLADVVLPAQAYTERDGTYTSGERRVQRFFPATLVRGETRPDYAITAQLGERLGLKLEGKAAALVFNRLAAAVSDFAGLSYRKLAETTEQFPIVGRGDLYYGGTTYENSQGLGAQLTPASQRKHLFQVPWEQPAKAAASSGLLAVPVTVLYDQGVTSAASKTLAPRLVQPHIRLNPQDAGRLGVTAGQLAEVEIHAAKAIVTVIVSDEVPAGIVLAPRSLGLPVFAPAAVEVRAAESLPA